MASNDYTRYFNAAYRRSPLFFPALPEGTLLASDGKGSVEAGPAVAPPGDFTANKLVVTNAADQLQSLPQSSITPAGGVQLSVPDVMDGAALDVTGTQVLTNGVFLHRNLANSEVINVFINSNNVQGATVGINSSGDMTLGNFAPTKDLDIFTTNNIELRTVTNSSDNTQLLVGPDFVATKQWSSLNVVHVGERLNFDNGASRRAVLQGLTGEKFNQITTTNATTRTFVYQTFVQLSDASFAPPTGGNFNIAIPTSLQLDQVVSIQCSHQLWDGSGGYGADMFPYIDPKGNIRSALPYNTTLAAAGECAFLGLFPLGLDQNFSASFSAARNASTDYLRVIISIVYAQEYVAPS